MIKLTLPLPPSVNKLYSRARNGGVYLNPKVREFREVVKEIVEASGHKPIYGRFRSRVIFHPASAREIDGDNYHKCLWDALEDSGLIENDKFNRDCHWTVSDEIKRPVGLCIVEIVEMR